jgi:hypothetical protein
LQEEIAAVIAKGTGAAVAIVAAVYFSLKALRPIDEPISNIKERF